MSANSVIRGRLPAAPKTYDAATFNKILRVLELALRGDSSEAAAPEPDPEIQDLSSLIALSLPLGNQTDAPHAFGATFASVGTATGAGFSASPYLSTQARHLLRSAVNNSDAGFHFSPISGLINGSGAGLGGGRMVVRFSFGTLTSSRRFFAGLKSSTGSLSATEPSAALHIIGFGADSTDTNVKVMHNDGSGTATMIDTGITVASLSPNIVLEVEVVGAVGGGSYVVILRRINGADSYDTLYTSAALVTDLPSVNVELRPYVHGNRVASAGNFDVFFLGMWAYRSQGTH